MSGDLPRLRLLLKHEALLIRRDAAVVGASCLLLGLAIVAGLQGRAFRLEAVATESAALEEAAKTMDSLRRAVDRSPDAGADGAIDGGSPRQVGSRPTPVFLPLRPLAPLAIGQTDLMPRRVDATILTTRRALARNYEIQNPAHLLSGPFDAAFVVVFLLPLVAGILGYASVTSEREGGTLALAASQPTSLASLFAGRVLVRGAFVALLAVSACAVAGAAAGIELSAPEALFDFVRFSAIAVVYALGWFLAATLMSAASGGSAAAAVALAATWLAFVVVAPVALNTVVSRVHEMPSRSSLTQESREAATEASREASAVMQQFLHDHPELMPQDGSVDMNDFFNRNRALEANIARRIDPLLDRFDEQLSRQQAAVKTLSFISPAIVAYEALVDLSGGSTERFARFKTDAWRFVEEKRTYFFRKAFRNERLNAADYANFPVFRSATAEAPSSRRSLGLLLLGSALLAAALFNRLRKLAPAA